MGNSPELKEGDGKESSSNQTDGLKDKAAFFVLSLSEGKSLQETAEAYKREEERQFKRWKRAFAPYASTVEEFAQGKDLGIEKYYHEAPSWMVWKSQGIEDLNVPW